MNMAADMCMSAPLEFSSSIQAFDRTAKRWNVLLQLTCTGVSCASDALACKACKLCTGNYACNLHASPTTLMCSTNLFASVLTNTSLKT